MKARNVGEGEGRCVLHDWHWLLKGAVHQEGLSRQLREQLVSRGDVAVEHAVLQLQAEIGETTWNVNA